MDVADGRAFPAQHRPAVVFTAGDGRPEASLVSCGLDGDGRGGRIDSARRG